MFKKRVKCEECKHYIDKEDAQKVLVVTYTLYRAFERYYYYCPLHYNPYTRASIYFRDARYYKEFQVTKDGEPVGYGKIECSTTTPPIGTPKPKKKRGRPKGSKNNG